MEQEYHFIRNALKLLGITLLVYLFMRFILPVVLPFFVAAFLASSVYPMTQKVAKKKKPTKKDRRKKLFSVLVSTLISVLIVGGIFLLIRYLGSQLMELWNNRRALFFWESFPDTGLLGKIKSALAEEVASDHMVDGVVKSLISGVTQMGETLGIFVTLVVVFVAAYLIVKDYEHLREMVKSSAFGEVVVALSKDVAAVGGTYLKAQGKIMLLVIAICAAALFVIKNPYFLLMGILIGLFDALPFLGTATIFVPWALIECLQGHWWLGLYYLLIAGATGILRQFLEPKLIGDGVGADPLAVLMSIYIGIQVFGWWGVILGPASAFLIWEIYRFT